MTLTLATAHTMARVLMDDHGLTDWSIAWDNAKKRYGQCQYGTRTLSFSKPLTVLREADDFRNTVLHEIAHALCPRQNHNAVWRRKFIAIGGDGTRCSEGPTLQAPWTGVHDGCSTTFPRHRRPSGQVYCPRCFKRAYGLDALLVDNSAAAITWVRTDSLVNA